MYYKIFKLHADLLKALSHPKRLEIIHLLRDQKLYVTQIQEMLDIPQANLSQHLHVLREADVVKTDKEGKQICYSLADKKFINACDLLREILIERYKNSDFADEFSMKMSDLVPVTHDPVCGMRISPKTASFAYPNNRHDYYFCASGCLERFKKNPDKFISEGRL